MVARLADAAATALGCPSVRADCAPLQPEPSPLHIGAEVLALLRTVSAVLLRLPASAAAHTPAVPPFDPVALAERAT
jgi:hypothetical protein